MRRNDAAMPRRSRPLLDRPPTAVHYRARYLKLNGRLMEPSQRVGVALRLLLDAGTLAPEGPPRPRSWSRLLPPEPMPLPVP